MTTTHPHAVELAGVTKTFGVGPNTVTAVNDISLTLDSGEIVALLGPNGAGKTSTLDMILGLTSPTRGQVRTFGQPPRRSVEQGRVAAVLQTGALLQDVSVLETVRMIASTFRAPAPIDDVMERAGITHLAKRRVSKCSGGEQQRLRFALALIPDPDLLILDEPTAGMDVSARRDFWAAMYAEASNGRTIVFATHYLEEAEDFAARIVLMSLGRVVADGPMQQIRELTKVRTVKARFADPAAAAVRLERLAGVTDVQSLDHQVTLVAADADAVARTILNDLGGHDIEVAAPSLEQAFLRLTVAKDEK